MNTITDQLVELLDLVKREQNAAYQEDEVADLLSVRALVSLGYAVDNLFIVSHRKDILVLRCDMNYSRFRVGDRLVLTSDNPKPINGTLLNISRNALELSIRVVGSTTNLAPGPWVAVGKNFDLSNAICSAIQKLIPGAPGWGFARKMLDPKSSYKPKGRLDSPKQARMLYQTLAEDSQEELDESQYQAFEKCVGAPALFGVKGPPGTGKTRLLAFVVEALVRQEQQVVVVAFTHQAVNNALTTIKQLFPGREVIKYGDLLRTEALDPDIKVLSGEDVPVFEKNMVVGMTYMSAIHRLIIRDRKLLNPNVLLIDEAGQLPLSQGISAGITGAGSILLFGDDQQMPPVFSGEVDEDPLAISLFAQLQRSQPNAVDMLRVSYRLNAELCEKIGSTFYTASGNSILQPSDTSKDWLFPAKYSATATSRVVAEALAREHSLVWIRTPNKSSVQYNKDEAALAAEIVITLLKNGLDPNNLAVVTPFRRQAANIRNLVSKEMGNSEELPIVDTVERVQGMTVDIVVVSFCASAPDYVARIGKFLFSPNRLNVAISRARMKAIILASPSIYFELPKDFQGLAGRKIFKQLFAEITEINLPLD